MTLVVALAACLATAAALVAARRRRERLLTAVHEIRGPLSAAHLALHAAARRGAVTPQVTASVALELSRISLATDDLLGGRRRRRAWVDLEELLETQTRTWAAVAAARGGRLELDCDAPGELVRADAARLAQAIGNVVANAIEHGGGTVRLVARRVGERVRIEVQDDGPGLPAAVAELVAGARRHGTRGRGMAIAARALEREGGRMLSLPAADGARIALDLPRAGRARVRR